MVSVYISGNYVTLLSFIFPIEGSSDVERSFAIAAGGIITKELAAQEIYSL
jgi:hypothetical protein